MSTLPVESSILGRYKILSELGRGGAATVYLAHDWVVDREVAVKVLREELSATIAHDRFAREIRLMSRIHHPHILPVLDCGEWKGQLFYVMPAVRGESLDRRLQRERQLGLDDVLRIARELCDALSYAHEHNIIHRDVKPGNIIEADGHAWLADFGIARALNRAEEETLSASGVVPGTTAYMSPEQAAGESPLDARTDQYSLACVMYEMLTGAPPFTDDNPRRVLALRLHVDPRPLRELRPDLPPRVQVAIGRALQRQPNERWESVSRFYEGLLR